MRPGSIRPSVLRRDGIAVAFLVQMLGACIVFAGWSVSSHVVSVDVLSGGVAASAFGMVLYLPITLGIPLTLPNLYRTADSGSSDGPADARAQLGILAAVITCVQVAAVVLLLLGHVDGRASALTVSIAGLLAAAFCLTQVARIHRSNWDLLWGSTAAATTPLMYVLGFTLGHDTGAGAFAVVGTLVLSIAITARFLSIGGGGVAVWHPRTLLEREPHSGRRIGKRLRAASYAVPHLIAMGPIMQGLRLFGSIRGEPAVVLQSHYLMLILNGAYTLIVGIDAVIKPRLQMTSKAEAVEVARRNGVIYLVAGVGSSVALAGIAVWPAHIAFAGFPTVNVEILCGLGLATVALAAYYFISSICLRFEATGVLSAASLSTVALMFGGFLVLPPSVPIPEFYGVAMTVLPVLLLLFAAARDDRIRDLVRSVARPMAAFGVVGALLAGVCVAGMGGW